MFSVSIVIILNRQENKNQQKALIISYLQDLKNGDTLKATEKVMFIDGEIHAGVRDVFCSAMEEYDYKDFGINDVKSHHGKQTQPAA